MTEKTTPDKKALKIRRVQEMKLKGKRVLVRVDYNVPMKGGAVTDNTRIRETIPTLKRILDEGAGIVLMAHLGRPKGTTDPKYSLKPVLPELEKLLGKKVQFSPDCVGAAAEKMTAALKPGDVVLLENLRYHSEEEENDDAFAKSLAKHGDVFVQDAFGALHRAHASTAGVPKHLPGCIGLLVQKELEFLDRVIGNPNRPFLAILGGAKVSDKIGVLQRLTDRVDAMIIGGGMAYTFLSAQNISIGKSLLEKEKIGEAKEIIAKAYAKNVELLLPADHLAVAEIKADAKPQETQGMAVPQGMIGVDIGPRTIEIIIGQIRNSKTIFWNGPMGIFEMEPFSKGTMAVAKAMAKATKSGAVTIVGGGDSLAALAVAKLQDKVTHCSTGGGASLEFLEGKALPGLTALGQ
ncbi:MAG: phosphoglycerate kinase [Elusimicrobia bacterium]|nr:phosphoglycerate kinase [Elusimicrobiota bacterium]